MIVLTVLKDVRSIPTVRQEMDPELTAGFIEGDMIIQPKQRNGLRSETYRWPNRMVFYHIDSNIGNVEAYCNC